MQRVYDMVPLLDVDGVVAALTERSQDAGAASSHCPHQASTHDAVSY